MKVGLFGLLGAGNIGNDGSLDAVLAYLREQHPSVELNCMTSGADAFTARYGIESTPMYWYYTRDRDPGLLARLGLKVSGKFRDAVRMYRWLRTQDVVVVPGAGVLENTLPVRPWGFPFSMFLVCALGRLTGTKVALVSIGANVINQPATRRLFRIAARSAHYRSYRDTLSRDAMRAMGVDTSDDDVFPDLVFALPTPAPSPERGWVGVGVMDYHGGTDDRRDAEVIHESYVDALRRFSRWLVANGRRVRFLTGDEPDHAVVRDIMADVRAHYPDLDDDALVFEPAETLGALMTQISQVDAVVGTRYHNVLCGLKLAKPTVSLSYAAKCDRIMAEMGLGDYTQDARHVDVDKLIEQFTELSEMADRVTPMLERRSAARAALLRDQFTALSAALDLPAREAVLS